MSCGMEGVTDGLPGAEVAHFLLGRKLVSHGQKIGQLADPASDWLFTLVQPIRSQLAC